MREKGKREKEGGKERKGGKGELGIFFAKWCLNLLSKELDLRLLQLTRESKIPPPRTSFAESVGLATYLIHVTV